MTTMVMNGSHGRRAFLRGAGVALALPLLEGLSSRGARAATTAAPRRLLCVANPLGMLPHAFFPAKAGSDYEITELLAPLVRHRKSFTLFSHLDHGPAVSGGHDAVHAFLTGLRDKDAGHWPERNISVDQRAAEFVGTKTRFPSLVLSPAGGSFGQLDCKLSWTRNGVNVPPVTRASALFRALFVDGDPSLAQREAASIDLDGSILDAVREHARMLEQRLGGADRKKLDEYMTSVRELERKLGMSKEWLSRPKARVAMAAPVDGSFTESLPVFIDMVVLALQTDSTRVATLEIPGRFDLDDLGLKGDYHGFSHHGKAEVLQRGLAVIEIFQTTHLARLLDKLGAAAEPQGTTLLDRTMVLFGSGMGNGSSHSNRDLPLLLAGGGFQHGEHKVFPTEARKRVPLCNLFLTLLQRFGLEIDRFNTSTGALPDFEAAG